MPNPSQWDYKNFKRGICYEKIQLKLNKSSLNQDVPSAPKANYERGGGCQCFKPTCSNSWKKYFEKFLAGGRWVLWLWKG